MLQYVLLASLIVNVVLIAWAVMPPPRRRCDCGWCAEERESKEAQKPKLTEDDAKAIAPVNNPGYDLWAKVHGHISARAAFGLDEKDPY